MKREFLSDRVAINYIDVDKFKSNYLSVSFVVPFDKKTSAMNELILKILKRGTTSYHTMIELSKALEYLYSADIFTKATCFGETQLLSFEIDALDNRFALDNTDILGGAMKILGEIIFSPVTENGVFNSDYFESEKRNQLDDIAAEINNKAKYAIGRLSEHMFANETYRLGSRGDIETVKAFTNEDVFNQYKHILSSANIEITFVGHTDETAFKRMLSDMLAAYNPSQKVETTTNVIRTVDNIKEVHETCVGKQGNLVMGFRTGTVLADGDYPRMALLSELYGGSANSMLFMNVREKMSLCYYCASIPEAIKGIMLVRAGIENKNYLTAKNAILDQLDRIKQGSFTNDDLAAAKLSLINAYREIPDNPNSMKNWYTGRVLSGITQSPEEAIKAVEAITKEEIVATARKIMLDTVYFLEGVQGGGEQ